MAENLETIKKNVIELDPKAEIFIFGSVAEKKYNYSSDIDIIIVTKLNSTKVHLELWKAGIRDPFEIHVHPSEKASLYKKWIKQAMQV